MNSKSIITFELPSNFFQYKKLNYKDPRLPVPVRDFVFHNGFISKYSSKTKIDCQYSASLR